MNAKRPRDPLAELVLLGGLLHCDATRDSCWPLSQWQDFGRNLGEREFLVFVWHVLYGVSYHRIGEVLGMSHGRAWQLYNRACVKLSRAMKPGGVPC